MIRLDGALRPMLGSLGVKMQWDASRYIAWRLRHASQPEMRNMIQASESPIERRRLGAGRTYCHHVVPEKFPNVKLGITIRVEDRRLIYSLR